MILFKKEREIGEIINDTFKFTRQNFKTLLKVFVKFVTPSFIILLLGVGYYSYISVNNNFFSSYMSGNPGVTGMDDLPDFFSKILLGSLFLIITLYTFYAFLFGSILYSIKSYIKNEGKIVIAEVGDNMKQNWGSLFGLSFASLIMLFVGFMLCIIPGIYLWPPLMLIYAIKVFNNLSISESISYSFKLIKNNWFTTFISFFIIGALWYFANMVFQLPIIIYSFSKGFLTAYEGTYANLETDWVLLSLQLLGSALQYVAYFIIVIASAFIYFNLNEKQQKTGAYEAIDELGKM